MTIETQCGHFGTVVTKGGNDKGLERKQLGGGRWEAANRDAANDTRILPNGVQKGEASILGAISKCAVHKPLVCWSGRGCCVHTTGQSPR